MHPIKDLRQDTFPTGNHSAWMESAAFDWRDATPLGNGTLGALHFGGLAHDRILFNHERYYGGSITPPLPDSSALLPEVRRLLDEGDFTKANDLYRQRWEDWGYEADSAHYLPGPVLNWRQQIPGAFHGYSRWVDFMTGVGGLDWRLDNQIFRRVLFTSMADGCCVFQPCEHGAPASEARLWFSVQDPSDTLDKHDLPLPLHIHQHTTFGSNWMASFFDGPERASCAVVAHWGDMLGTQIDGRTMNLTLQPGCQILISMLVSPTREGVKKEVARLAELSSVKNLRYRHEEIHKERYGRCVLDLDVEHADLSNDELLMKAYRGDVPDALLARMANFGRYLLIGSATKGTLPPNLQGIWNGNHQPPWWCVFFFNENLQQALWPALPGGLPECVEGLFGLLEERMDDFRTNAKNMFGCRGILPPLYMSPDCGLKKNPQAHVQYWTGSGAWLAQIYQDYWLHTGDRDFLEKRAIPFFREVAAFYEDFLVEGADGLLHNYPANSPENNPLGHVDRHGDPARVCVWMPPWTSHWFARCLEISSRQPGLSMARGPRISHVGRRFLGNCPNTASMKTERLPSGSMTASRTTTITDTYPTFTPSSPAWRSPQRAVSFSKLVELRWKSGLLLGLSTKQGGPSRTWRTFIPVSENRDEHCNPCNCSAGRWWERTSLPPTTIFETWVSPWTIARGPGHSFRPRPTTV